MNDCLCKMCSPDKRFSVEDLAKLVLHTADTREASWNRESYNCAIEQNKRQFMEKDSNFDNLNSLYWYWHDDPVEFYDMTIEQAAEHSCKYLKLDVKLVRFIDLAFHWWNDVIWWAEDILGLEHR